MNAAHHIPPREHTQRLLDQCAQAASAIKPTDAWTLADRLEAQVDAFAKKTFLLCQGQRYSYRELDARANQYARAFAQRGLKAGDVCALMLENRPDFYFCWFGLAKLGVVAAFINHHARGRALAHALHSTGAKAVVAGEECLHALADSPEVKNWPRWLIADEENPASAELRQHADTGFQQQVWQADASRIGHEPRRHLCAADTLLLIFTSGTTGLPKAARYSHLRWMVAGDVMAQCMQVTPADVFYCCLPLYHGAAATSLTSTALRAGASIVLRRKFSASAFWPEVRTHGVTVFQYIGEICRYLLNRPACADDREHRLRCMLGAGLSPDIWQRWLERFGQMQIVEGWGSTEANTSTLNLDNYPGSCGRVPFWDKTNLRLLRYDLDRQTHVRDEHGFYRHCEPGEIGEAVGMIVTDPEIGGGRFEGYTSAQETEKKILRNVFKPGDAWWSSGDLLRYDENGYCYFVDRIGDTFRWKSENVSTQEVADALGNFPGLELINIYGVRVPGHEGRAGMAAIQMQLGRQFDCKAFYDFTLERVPRYAAPVFVRVCASADMTSTFKLRKVDLQRQGYAPELFQDPLYVRDEACARYCPWSLEVLARNGLPPFEEAS